MLFVAGQKMLFVAPPMMLVSRQKMLFVARPMMLVSRQKMLFVARPMMLFGLRMLALNAFRVQFALVPRQRILLVAGLKMQRVAQQMKQFVAPRMILLVASLKSLAVG